MRKVLKKNDNRSLCEEFCARLELTKASAACSSMQTEASTPISLLNFDVMNKKEKKSAINRSILQAIKSRNK